MPMEHLCPSPYLTGLVLGTQKHFKKNQVKYKSHPKNKEFAGAVLYPVVAQYKSVLAALPERWHRTGKLAGCLIFEDIEFIYNIFATVEPEAFAAFEKAQWEK